MSNDSEAHALVTESWLINTSVCFLYLNPRQSTLNRRVSHGVRSAKMTPFLVFSASLISGITLLSRQSLAMVDGARNSAEVPTKMSLESKKKKKSASLVGFYFVLPVRFLLTRLPQ